MIRTLVILSLFLLQILPENGFEVIPYNIIVKVANIPDNQIILGKINGDKFTPLDSTNSAKGLIQFKLPADCQPGVYRLILGQTTYAKIMNEPPQQLDFIFNNENIDFTTDFKSPHDSLTVSQSDENKIWHSFIKKEKTFKRKFLMAEKELDYYRDKNDISELDRSIKEYNRLQKQRTELIDEAIRNHPDLFATKLIKMHREPFLDGNLIQRKRVRLFKSEYFENVEFNDETLINSSVYTEKAFMYLMKYAQRGLTREQQLQEFKNAVDIILYNTNGNEKIYEHILDYLIRGFERLNLNELLTYIAVQYSGTTCQTDEVTTLERRLEAHKMKPGTVVPDFTLNDLNNDPVRLTDVLKSRNILIFWASWCPHCNIIIPEILKWQRSNSLSDLEIIAIALDEQNDQWQEKVFELGIESWFNLSSLKKWDCPVATDYNVYATPTMFVIDQKRRITGKPLTLDDLKVLISK